MNGAGKSEPLTAARLRSAVRSLAAVDPLMGRIFDEYGEPPLWNRPPGFATLLHIILEQQVSLASAKACFDKLNARVGTIEPNSLLQLAEPELKAVGFSRQKMSYAKHLAEAVLDGRFDFSAVHKMDDAEAKAELTKLKGVGIWTADIYLIMAMLRPDVMPKGDIALHAAWHKVSGIGRPDADEFQVIAERWAPHRSTAARLLWHFYLSSRKNKMKL